MMTSARALALVKADTYITSLPQKMKENGVIASLRLLPHTAFRETLPVISC